MQKPRTIGELQGRPTAKPPRVRDPAIEKLRNSNRWRQASKLHLSSNPLCVHCDQYNRLTPAQCVDHIIPWRGDTGLMWAEWNWQSLCNRCHGRKGIKELDMPYRAIDGRYVVTGKRGTGKSTWVAEHAVSGDTVWDLELEAERRGFGSYPRTDSQMKVLYSVRDKLIDQLTRNTSPCYVIVHDRLRAGLYAHRLGARVVAMDCGEDTRRRQLMARDGNVDDVVQVGGW